MPYSDLTKGRYSHSGFCYHITTVTRDRRAVFTNLTAGRVVVRELMALQADAWAETLCFVVMSDHLHWLMQLNDKQLRHVMQRLKGRTSRQLGGRLWQERYYDHAVRGEEDIRILARYIVANPLRKGLV
ncbi:MAG: REP-associated tyrosine transposase, partial [Methylococcales bacterium]